MALLQVIGMLILILSEQQLLKCMISSALPLHLLSIIILFMYLFLMIVPLFSSCMESVLAFKLLQVREYVNLTLNSPIPSFNSECKE